MACLDNTVLLDLLGRGGKHRRAGAQQAVARLALSDQPHTTTRFNLAELLVGVDLSADPDHERRQIDLLLADLELLEFDAPSTSRFATISAHLTRIGRPAGDMDTLIAAVALSNDQALITRNPRHFADIPGLAVETY